MQCKTLQSVIIMQYDILWIKAAVKTTYSNATTEDHVYSTIAGCSWYSETSEASVAHAEEGSNSVTTHSIVITAIEAILFTLIDV